MCGFQYISFIEPVQCNKPNITYLLTSSTFEGCSDPPLMPNSSGQSEELIVYIIPPE